MIDGQKVNKIADGDNINKIDDTNEDQSELKQPYDESSGVSLDQLKEENVMDNIN